MEFDQARRWRLLAAQCFKFQQPGRAPQPELRSTSAGCRRHPSPQFFFRMQRAAIASVLTWAHCAAALDPSLPVGAALDATFSRLAPGQLEAELRSQSAPAIPFQPFSEVYVAKALATPTNWTALGAVTPVKNQGPHGYCGTFGRVGSCEGQFFLKAGKLVSFSEEELVDCVGWDKDQFTYFSPHGFMTTAEYPYNLSAYKDQVRQQPPACRIRASARPHAVPPLAAPASAAPRWQAVTHAMIWPFDFMARALCRIHPSQVTRAVTTGSSWFPAQPMASLTEPQAAPPA
jgi:hypothetical protein|eukprot:COSAG06_NODE_228_length_19725_cov_8.167839_10_plen_289_part_00